MFRNIWIVIAALVFLGMTTTSLDGTDKVESYIIDLSTGNKTAFEAQLLNQYGRYHLKCLNADLAYYRLDILPTGRQPEATLFLDNSRKTGLINDWQKDHPVKLRSTPNDPLWGQQWNLMRIGAEDAWDRTTGGLTRDRDTIVVAVLDAGFEITHPDLSEVYWKNHKEAPGDGIDNDQNGYTDDYVGINIETGTDDHPANAHGTSVTGIIGARGNNGKGIAGVNWSVRILPISGIHTESEIIEGYAYVKALRQRYNDSNGKDGAFVVATNLSAGIDGAVAQDHPMWCAAYDDLGSVGILSVAATTNRNTDVDAEGDMPSTCTSNFLVAVTMTDPLDQKPLFAGYGAQHVDLGAPGTNLLTTYLSGDYADFDGTSAAAPHVTGAIGLLYSVSCDVFMEIVRTEPAAAASLMRSILLGTVDVNSNLEGITATGGRLNLYGAVKTLEDNCGTFGGEFSIISVYPNPARNVLHIAYDTPDFSAYFFRVIDILGREILMDAVYPSALGTKYHNLNTSRLTPGVYYMTLSGKKQSQTVAFIVH